MKIQKVPPSHLFGMPIIIVRLNLLLLLLPLDQTCSSKATILPLPTNKKSQGNGNPKPFHPASPAVDNCDAAKDHASCDHFVDGDADQDHLQIQQHELMDKGLLDRYNLNPVTIKDMDKYEQILSQYSDRHEGTAKILISFASGHRANVDDEDVGPGTKFAAELAMELQKKDYMAYSTLHTMVGVAAHEEFLNILRRDCQTLMLIVTRDYVNNLHCLDILDKAIEYGIKIIPILYGLNSMPDDTDWWPNAIGPVYKNSRNRVIGSAVLHHTPFKVRELHLGPNEDLINRIIRTTHGITRKHVQEWERRLRALSDENQSKNTDVVISYATGNTEHDDGGLGSGTKFVAELAIKLEEEGIRTHTRLHTTTGAHWWDEYSDKLQNECKVLVLILTPAFFKCHECLRELYTVDMNHVTIVPVRFGAFPRNKEDWWPDFDLPDEGFEEMREVVLEQGKLDVQFFNRYFAIDEPTVELVDEVKRQILLGDRNNVSWDTIHVLLGAILALCMALGFLIFFFSTDTDKAYDACFLILQPSSAPPSSHSKLKADLQFTKIYIETKNILRDQKVILHGGTGREVRAQLQASQDSNPDQALIRTQVCFVFGYGIDESLWSSYLDAIIQMMPKIVVVCIRHGAKRVGEYLSTRGVDIVFWMHFDTSCIDRRSFLTDACLPFSENLLMNKGMSARACWEEFIKYIDTNFPFKPDIVAAKNCTSGALGSKIDDTNIIKKKTRHGGGNVEMRISDFGKATLFGFDRDEQAFRSYRASHIPWIEPLKEKLKGLSGTQRARYLHVKIKAESKTTARDLMHLLCLCAVDDETLDVSGVYLVSCEDSRNEVCDKIRCEQQTEGVKGNIIVWIECVGETFPKPGDLVKWFGLFKNIPVTVFLASYPNDNIDEYVEALEDFEGDELDIRDSSASHCDMTSHSLPDHSRYQGTIRIDLPNHISSGDISSIVDLLKEYVATLANTKAERMDAIIDDKVGLVWIVVGVRDVRQSKVLLHNLLHGGLEEICPGATFGAESALTLYREAALQLNTLTEEQIEFIDHYWMKPKNRHLHLKGAAGTGKTFIALHCCLDFLTDTRATENRILFICPTEALTYHFARWLLVRVTRNPTMRKSLLQKITFLVPGESDWKAFQIRMDRSNRDDLKEDETDINEIDFGKYGLVVVDEAQAVFCQDAMNLPASLLVSLQEEEGKKDRKLLLLSDTSQAQSVFYPEIHVPFAIDMTYELETVSRSSENIVAASLPYQLGEKSKCVHGVIGPRVKVHLFHSITSAMSDPDHYSSSSSIGIPSDLSYNEMETKDQYASKVEGIVHEIHGMLDNQENLHKFIAIIVPNKDFRQKLICNKAFQKLVNLKAVTAKEAMKRKGPDAADNTPWVVVDTVCNVSGLEFGAVIALGLDQCIKGADPADNKKVQSNIFRSISRGHYIVFILNHIIKDGWFEWLVSVVVTTPNKSPPHHSSFHTTEDPAISASLNASSNFNQAREEFVDEEAVKGLVSTMSSSDSPLTENDNSHVLMPLKKVKYPDEEEHLATTPKLWYGDTFEIFIYNEDGIIVSANISQDPNALLFAPTKVGTNRKSLANASPNLKANKAYVLVAVQRYGHVLQFASAELKADKAIVLAAVQQNGGALRYASAELKADKTIVLAAVQQDGWALQYASTELKADKAIVLTAVQQNGYALQHASAELQADKAIVLAVVQQDGDGLLQYASTKLKADKAIVLAAVQQEGLALQFASAELQEDKAIVLVAVQQNGYALQFASAELKADKAIVLVAVEQNGYALESASAELKADKAIVLAAVQQNGGALFDASAELKADKTIVLAAVQQYSGALHYASAKLKADQELRKAAGWN